LVARAAGQSEIADGKHMRPAGLGMAPAIAERVELLDIAEIEPGLPLDPFAQADLERAMGAGRERAEGKRVPCTRAGRAGADDENMRLARTDRDDGGVETEFDLRVAALRPLCFGGFASRRRHDFRRR